MDDLMTTSACTLPTDERPWRLAEFDALFAAYGCAVERRDLEVRIRLTGPGELMEVARDLAERETACCSFFTFLLEGDGGDLTMTISVPEARREILDALARRAEELATGELAAGELA